MRHLFIALVLVCGPAHAATVDPEFVRFHGDPEPIKVSYLGEGRWAFAKEGAYNGPLKGEAPCVPSWMTTPYNYVCKPTPRFVNVRQGSPHPDTDFPMAVFRVPPSEAFGYREAHSLSTGTWLAGHADAAGGYGDSYLAASDYQFEYVSYFTETTTINVEGCGCRQEPETPPPPAIPLPASAWMLMAAIGGLALLRVRA